MIYLEYVAKTGKYQTNKKKTGKALHQIYRTTL